MRRLLRVELTRARWRRAVLVLFLAAVVVPAVVGVSRVWDTQPASAEELARVDAQVAEERDRPRVQRELERCLAKPQRYGVPEGDDVRAACESMVLPTREWFGYYPELDLAEERGEGSGLAVVIVLGALMVLAGTTFAGHDWNSGSMSNQLLFEPRRVRVWVAKALVLTSAAVAVAMAVLTAYWLALVGVVRSRGTEVSSAELVDCLQQGLRGAAVVGAGALAGYALTMLFRSTVVTLGVFFAVSVAGGLLIALAGLDGRWQPQVNVTAVVADGTTYYVEPPPACYTNNPPTDPGACDEQATLTASSGALYLGSGVVLATVPSLLSFRRRDVS
jgi:ABC-2 type transport system permease protein